MSEKTNDKLARELREAYGRNLPGDDFDDAVMERTLTESGGEHEVALAAPGGRRWWPFAVAAAVVLLVVGAWQLSGPAPQEPPPFFPLPTLAAPGNERIVVDLEVDGTIRVGGKVLTEEELKTYLTLRVAECRGDRDPQEPYVFLNGKKGVFPPSVARLARLCRDPPISIRKIQYGSDGKVSSMTWPTPPVAETNRHIVRLERGLYDISTHVRLDDRDLGTGDAAFNALAVALKGSKLKSGKIDAYGLTPIADLRRAIAALRSVGIFDVEWTAEYLKAGPRPKIHLCLQLVDRKAQLSILAERISSGVMRVQSDPDKALLALDAMIRKLVTAGLEPVGLVDASRYMDQKIVDRILDLFKKHGIDDVLIIR